MIGFIKKIFGTKHDRDVKELRPLVDEINNSFAALAPLSDEELRAMSSAFRERINAFKHDHIATREELNAELQNADITHDERLEIYRKLEESENAEFSGVSDILDEILPEAFAVVKEVARRLTERKHRYSVTGHEQTWAMVPYDVQLMGGIVIHQGKISEMATGEGKTLVAVAPMYLNALSGYGVHLVTVNDYLARRDCEWMKPVFDFLGITVGCIQSNMEPHDRKEQYDADITYGTNNEFGFDYLRDNMVNTPDDMVQRKHYFAIVDEVDSVLIDEARTPLIISGPVGQSSDAKYVEMNPRVRRLVEGQNRLVNSIVGEADTLMKTGKKEDREKAGVNLLRAYRAFPKHKRLQKLLQEPDTMKLMRETELDYMRDQSARMHEIDEELFYTIDEKQHTIDIHEKGRELLATANEDSNMFLIPDITSEMSVIEGNSSISPDERQVQKDHLMMLYADRSDRIHIVTQLLRAYSLYERDDEYVVQDNKVKIVDEFTGRILDGRRYSDGLHQAIEAKEGVQVERDTQTYATVTLQNYFRLYRKLAGMTGTAETEAGEFYQIYKLDVVVIPTNKQAVRKDMDDLIYRTKREKYNAVVEEIQKELLNGRAILVGTASVEVSEILSKMLRRANIPHNVLNAKHHEREAEIITEAGRKGAVTIATNMAGRGTDIKLDSDVKENGGLCIIGTERHEARRIDRQLRGRAGRQGDPGSSQFFISLEDELMRLFGGERITSFMQTFKVNLAEGEPIQAGMVTKSVERAQKKVEENNFGIRKRLLDYDNVMNQQREVVYDRRRHALGGERMKSEIFAYVEELAGEWYDVHQPNGELDDLKNHVRTVMLCDVAIDDGEFRRLSREECVQRIVEAAEEFYNRKEEQLGSDFMAQLERFAILQAIDDKWREHLRVMDELKEGIHLRAYGQKDPLLEYKGEAFRVFEELISEISKEAVEAAFKYFPVVEQPRAQVQPTRRPAQQPATNELGVPVNRSVSTSVMNFSHPTTTDGYYSNSTSADDNVAYTPPARSKVQTVYRDEPRIGRNDPCPCGSGKKYKQCHGKN
ncbi:MAG: preprotein translocase subunit SecA [Candidatus Kapabacteria bacterium]|nr:preprotein translocase subunit SecA [Candidatus Kapabacteria bacterium]